MIATVLGGLALGAVYTLVGIGFNIAWLTTRAINFAQGGFVMAGAFLTVFLGSQGVPTVVVFLILLVVGAVLAAVEYALAIQPVQARGEHAELVTTVGFITVIQGVILFFVSDDALRVPSLVSGELIAVPGGFVSPSELLLIGVAVLVGVAAHLWSWHTRFGLAAMGVSEDREAAMVLGVNTRRFSYLTFMASGALGFGIAQVVGPETFAIVALATLLSIKGFVALAIGGFGSNLGVLIGGLAVGVVEALVARTVGAAWQNSAVFVIFVVLMLVRPRGLFGEAKERVV